MSDHSSYDSDSDPGDDFEQRGQLNSNSPPPSLRESYGRHAGDVPYSSRCYRRVFPETYPSSFPHGQERERGAMGFAMEGDYSCLSGVHQHIPGQASQNVPCGQPAESIGQSAINIKTLEDWANTDNFTILVFSVSVNMESVMQILREHQLPLEWLFQLINVFKKCTLVTSQQDYVNGILTSVLKSNFFDSQMINFFQEIPHHRRLYSQMFSILQNVFDIIDYILKNLPQHTQKCYSSLHMIKEIGRKINILRDGNNLTVRLSHLIRKAEENTPFLAQRRKMKQRRVKEIPRPHDEAPPQDFSTLTIFPDLEELKASYEPFLRANKTHGPYRDVQHYTDVHFRLLREDYLSPIRNGIKDYKDALDLNEKVKSQELRFYLNVQLVKMVVNEKDGIHFIVKFDDKELKDVNWEFSRRFMFGALLCFSKDDFETVIFATVAHHDPEEHAEGRIRVAFESNLEEVFTTSENDIYVMAETVSFFESYRHVLEGLQEVESLPLSANIVRCRKTICPPQYIDDNTDFDFSPVMKEGVDQSVELLSSTDWPDQEETILNESQLDAVKLALTKELAIIQGPPGTGKTYVGLKIIELLLKNKTDLNNFNGPILVVCYTNHALDQFLEGILEFCPTGIVRVGGRSQSKLLERFNLMELTRNQKINKWIKKSIDKKLSFCSRRLKVICRSIKALWHESLNLETTILTVEDLRDEISHIHMESLRDKSRSDGITNRLISQWMKSSSANMERHINQAAKRHLTYIIVGEGSVREDTILVTTVGMINPDFEIRSHIYRGWLQKYQDKLKIALDKQCGREEKLRLTKEIMHQKEEAVRDILPDELIVPYMTSVEIFEYIQKCVELDRGECYEGAFVKTWLLGLFRSTDQVLDAVSRLSRSTKTVSSQSRKDKNYEEINNPPSGWVIEESDDSDNDSTMGFDIRHEDEDEEEDSSGEDSPVETSADISEFKRLEAEFKHSERKEILLLQRAKLLGIDLSEESENSEEWQTPNTMTYSKVFRLIHSKEPFSEAEASSNFDVWSLSLPERYRLYKYWMLKKKSKIAHQIIHLTRKYNDFFEMKKEALAMKRIAILKGAQVIGMTTTGAARYRKLLKQVAPRIIVVEEAAEVLEAHIITTLNKHCKHLILIGDHQQLRPNPTVYRLAKDYEFEMSLFERLVNNELPMVILEEQHRMRPEISNYLRIIYPNLIDHDTVKHYEDISGVSSNMFFLHHEFEERNVLDSASKENIHEAEFMRELCKYFLSQGYTGWQITILAAYGGQVNVLRENMANNDTYEHIRITSIDNYQGEENDIILLSLVRSNLVGEVGFLKTHNRVCVALSRARRGLFVIGNLKLLAEQSMLWKEIIDMAKKTDVFGCALKLPCVNHVDHISVVRSAEDFHAKVPEGGCHLPCEAQLDCGHKCPRQCHTNDRDHMDLVCQQPCLNKCSEGHRCQKNCYQECGHCEVLVKKTIPICGHVDLVACHEDASEACCHQPCAQKISCGHICKGFCGVCLTNSSHEPCEEKVQLEWPCSHINTVPCHTDVKQYPCPALCRENLNCGHRCKGTCGECLSGKVHNICSYRCEKLLPCGHQCSGKCGELCSPCQLRCPFVCSHGACSKTTCGEFCDSCMENCAMICKHQSCYEKCTDECKRPPCKRKCPLRTKCQHTCASLCGEECVCYICDKDNFKLLDLSKKKPGRPVPLASKERALKVKVDESTFLMKIPSCGHIFTINQLEQYVNEFDPEGTHYIRCPICVKTIYGINLFKSQNKFRMMRRENRKYDIIKKFTVPESEIEKLSKALQLSDQQLKDLNCNKAEAIKYNRMFISALEKIETMHEHFNWVIDFNTNKWRSSILCIQTRVTTQFIEEMTMEFHRLLIIEQMAALKRMIDDYGHSLEEPLKSRCKIKKQLQQKMSSKLRDSAQSLLGALYEVVFSFREDSRIEEDVTDLLEMTQKIKDVLGQYSKK